ncbi:hypothetical protein [Corynebacterium sp.]|nr:hypothetical protein [Corynebacterium sp.]
MDTDDRKAPASEIPRRIIEESTLDPVIYADPSGTIRLWDSPSS